MNFDCKFLNHPLRFKKCRRSLLLRPLCISKTGTTLSYFYWFASWGAFKGAPTASLTTTLRPFPPPFFSLNPSFLQPPTTDYSFSLSLSFSPFLLSFSLSFSCFLLYSILRFSAGAVKESTNKKRTTLSSAWNSRCVKRSRRKDSRFTAVYLAKTSLETTWWIGAQMNFWIFWVFMVEEI